MIQSLYNMGKAMRADPHYESYFETYADPFAGYEREKRVVVIPILRDQVQELEVINFSAKHSGRYLFRKPASSNGAPIVATGPLYPVVDLSSEKKRKAQEENVRKLIGRLKRTIPAGKSAYFSDATAQEKGLKDIKRALKEFEGQNGVYYIYTVRIDGKWLNEIEELKEMFDREAYSSYYKNKKSQSWAKGKTCALTGVTNVEVWGRVNTLGFTVNDRSYNRGGFDDKYSYRMFPVSQDAVQALEAASRFSFTKLAAAFHPLEYIVVPRVIEKSEKLLLELVDTLARRSYANRFEQQVKPILDSDDIIEAAIGEGEVQYGHVLYDILFYQRKQAQFAINLYIQDISPSYLAELKDIQRYVQRRYASSFSTKKEHFTFTLKTLRNFFLKGSRTNTRLHPDFFRLLEGLFYAEPLPEQLLLQAIMSRVRASFKNRAENDYMAFDVMRGIASWQYVAKLNLIQNIQLNPMEEKQTAPVFLDIDGYLNDHAEYYNRSPALRGAFLVGVLTGMLTYAQYKSLNSRPFLSQLNSLNLNVNELCDLIPKLMDKISQYQDRTTTARFLPYLEVTHLMAEATDLLTQSGEKVSRDQTSFAFVSGMVIQQRRGLQLADVARARKEAESSAPASSK